MRGNSFYNTIGAQGQVLIDFESTACSLEEFILLNLKKDLEYTPYDVLEMCALKGYKTKENSVRRALCNLTKKNKIERTKNERINYKYSNVPNKTIKII